MSMSCPSAVPFLTFSVSACATDLQPGHKIHTATQRERGEYIYTERYGEILKLNVGAINYNSRLRAKKKEFTFMVAYTWCGRWFPMFAGLFCVSVFNYGQLAGEKFVSLQLPVFYISFFNLISLPLYCIWYLAGSIHSQNPIETTLSLYSQPELNLNWNFFAAGFLINAVTVLPASNCRSFFILYFFVIFAGTDSCLSHWLWDNLYQFGPLTVSQPGESFIYGHWAGLLLMV